MSHSNPTLLTIHQFAELCRTTVRTVRFYDKLGLLKPVKIDQFTKYRYYDPSQGRDFFHIKLLQNFDIALKEIPTRLEHSSASAFLQERLDQVQKEIQNKQKEYKFLQEIKEFVFQHKMSSKKLKFEYHGPFLLFATHIPHGQFHLINSIIAQLYKQAQELKIPFSGKEMTLYYDSYTYKPHDTRLEIGLICKSLKMPKNIKLPSNTYFKRFPKTKAWTYTYQGPYEYLTFIHKRMEELTIDKKLSALPFDIHAVGPLNAEFEYDHLTKVGYPLG